MSTEQELPTATTLTATTVTATAITTTKVAIGVIGAIVSSCLMIILAAIIYFIVKK